MPTKPYAATGRTRPLTRPAPAGESAGRGPPSPLGRGQRSSLGVAPLFRSVSGGFPKSGHVDLSGKARYVVVLVKHSGNELERGER